MRRHVISTLVLAATAAAASGQSVNIAFGPPGTVPSATYGAAAATEGLAGRGVWNAVGLLPASQRQFLNGLHGAAVNARVYQIGASALLSTDNPETSGDDERLLDDMLLSSNNPVDACFWVEGLRAGTYDVIIYALTPDDRDLRCRTRVDFASPGPTMVGGAWSGNHERSVSYSVFSVTTSNGVIGLHSGLFGGVIQSGVNGFQIIERSACPADWNSSGAVTVDDMFSFLASYFNGDEVADVNASGSVTVQDIFEFLALYFAPCP